MVGFYLTAGLFVVIVLGSIAAFRFFDFPLSQLHQRRASSGARDKFLGNRAAGNDRENAAPRMLRVHRGTGHSDRLQLQPRRHEHLHDDGSRIPSSGHEHAAGLGQQLDLLLVAMISSKGASGVTGAGFITLAATLSAVPSVPIASLAILVGIDRFMSECRAITNLIGNGVATVVVSRWEKELDKEVLNANLRKPKSVVDLTQEEVAEQAPVPHAA